MMVVRQLQLFPEPPFIIKTNPAGVDVWYANPYYEDNPLTPT